MQESTRHLGRMMLMRPLLQSMGGVRHGWAPGQINPRRGNGIATGPVSIDPDVNRVFRLRYGFFIDAAVRSAARQFGHA